MEKFQVRSFWETRTCANDGRRWKQLLMLGFQRSCLVLEEVAVVTSKENDHPGNDLGFLCRGPQGARGLACWRLSDRSLGPVELVMWRQGQDHVRS